MSAVSQGGSPEHHGPTVGLQRQHAAHAVPFELTSFVQAEQVSSRIANSRAHGRLDLGGLQLKNVPTDVFDLIVLISLSLDSNDLHAVPDDVKRLILLQARQGAAHQRRACLTRSLQELSAKCNKLDTFPMVVTDMPGLTMLDLSFNTLTALPLSGLRNLKSLREMRLSNNTLISLPDEVAQLQSLEELHVEGNLLKRLPELGALRKLRVLIAYDNKLQSAPRALPASLETIDLSRNDMTTLSGSNVCAIAALTTLDLSSNRLTELPRFKSARLEELAVADNRLESLSPLEDLPALRVLDASRNQLRTLPFSIGALGHLAEVHLRNNSLEVLPPSLGMCQSLRLLDVSDNKLEALPEELALVAGLTHLKARHNQLLWVPAQLSALPALVELDLFNNRRIANIPVEMVRNAETPARAVLRHLSTLVGQPVQQQHQLQQQQQQQQHVLTPQSTYRTPRAVAQLPSHYGGGQDDSQRDDSVVGNVPPMASVDDAAAQASVVTPPSALVPSAVWAGWWPAAAAVASLSAVVLAALLWQQRRRRP